MQKLSFLSPSLSPSPPQLLCDAESNRLLDNHIGAQIYTGHIQEGLLIELYNAIRI